MRPARTGGAPCARASSHYKGKAMKVSTTSVKITPQGTFYLDGYLNDIRQEPGTGVHDDPLAVLLLMEEGGARALFVGIDVCLLSLSRTREMRLQLRDLLDIPDELLVVSTVHSHSCPNGLRDGSLIKKETPGYADYVSGLVVQAASRLPQQLVEAEPEMLRTHIRGWYSNRNSKTKPFDDEAFVIRFRDASGRAVAAMQNFNCHSTVVGPQNTLITSDLQGAVRARLADWLGVVPYAFTGASGDLGNRQFRRGNDFAELARVSCGIAGELMQGEFEPVSMEGLSVREFTYRVDYNNGKYWPDYERQLAEAHAVLDDESSSADAKKLAATEVSKLGLKLRIDRVTFPIVMRVIQLGDVVFVTFPGELGSALGMRIKAMFPGKTCIVIGYANDAQGYFVPKEDWGLGYESFVTQLPPGGIETVLDAFEEQL